MAIDWLKIISGNKRFRPVVAYVGAQSVYVRPRHPSDIGTVIIVIITVTFISRLPSSFAPVRAFGEIAGKSTQREGGGGGG